MPSSMPRSSQAPERSSSLMPLKKRASKMSSFQIPTLPLTTAATAAAGKLDAGQSNLSSSAPQSPVGAVNGPAKTMDRKETRSMIRSVLCAASALVSLGESERDLFDKSDLSTEKAKPLSEEKGKPAKKAESAPPSSPETAPKTKKSKAKAKKSEAKKSDAKKSDAKKEPKTTPPVVVEEEGAKKAAPASKSKKDLESLGTLEQHLADRELGLRTFPDRLMKLLSDDSMEDILTWHPSGRAFFLVNPQKLVTEVLPDYFGMTRFTVFYRALLRWGFFLVTKGEESGAFCHKFFLRDDTSQINKMCLKESAELKLLDEMPSGNSDDATMAAPPQKAKPEPSAKRARSPEMESDFPDQGGRKRKLNDFSSYATGGVPTGNNATNLNDPSLATTKAINAAFESLLLKSHASTVMRAQSAQGLLDKWLNPPMLGPNAQAALWQNQMKLGAFGSNAMAMNAILADAMHPRLSKIPSAGMGGIGLGHSLNGSRPTLTTLQEILAHKACALPTSTSSAAMAAAAAASANAAASAPAAPAKKPASNDIIKNALDALERSGENVNAMRLNLLPVPGGAASAAAIARLQASVDRGDKRKGVTWKPANAA